jgi:hypothetical protein
MGMRHGWEHQEPFPSPRIVPDPVEAPVAYPSAAALAEEWDKEQHALAQRQRFRLIHSLRDDGPIQVA